jgi:hypothetical protein
MLLRIRRALRKRKRFSVITPTLNPGPKLEATINSVLSQNGDLFEYIIVDGGSTDETLSIVRKHGRRIKWISEKDRGVYDAMNKGIKMATGGYLYFLGAGDHLRENILEKIKKFISDEPLTFIYGNVYLVDERREYTGEFDEEKIRMGNICHQAIFYERTIFDVLGPYDLKYSLLADWALNIRCFADKRIQKIYVPEVVADYEGGGISITGVDIDFYQYLKSSITADPNPIQDDGSGLGVTSISYTFFEGEPVEIRVGAPDGPLFARPNQCGQLTTGKWVTDRMIFFLQDVSRGKPLTKAHTLATVTILLREQARLSYDNAGENSSNSVSPPT